VKEAAVECVAGVTAAENTFCVLMGSESWPWWRWWPRRQQRLLAGMAQVAKE